jgi:hypothetical protein
MKSFKMNKNKNAEDVDISSVPGLIQALAVRKKTRSTSLKGAKGPTTPIILQALSNAVFCLFITLSFQGLD